MNLAHNGIFRMFNDDVAQENVTMITRKGLCANSFARITRMDEYYE